MGLNKKEKEKIKKKKEKEERQRIEKRNQKLILFCIFGLFFIGGILFSLLLDLDGTITVGLFSRNFCGYGDDWIHIKVENDSNYKRLVEICNHEAGHELFCRLTNSSGVSPNDCWGEVGENYAEVCEKYPNICLENEYKDYSTLDIFRHIQDNGMEGVKVIVLKDKFTRNINITWYEGDLTRVDIMPTRGVNISEYGDLVWDDENEEYVYTNLK